MSRPHCRPWPRARAASTWLPGPDGGPHAVTLHQDARIHRAVLADGQPLTVDLAPDRHAWVQIARGHATVLGRALSAGDGLAVSGAERLDLAGAGELLLFDLA